MTPLPRQGHENDHGIVEFPDLRERPVFDSDGEGVSPKVHKVCYSDPVSDGTLSEDLS